jgi:hypothetical protein
VSINLTVIISFLIKSDIVCATVQTFQNVFGPENKSSIVGIMIKIEGIVILKRNVIIMILT